MSKKLNIIEAMKMPVDTEFKIKYSNGMADCHNIKSENLNGVKLFKWSSDNIAIINENITNATFIPIQQPVSFMEVLEGLSKCNINNEIVKGVYEKLRENNNAHEFYKREIIKGLLNGEFYYIHDIIYALSGCMSCSNWKNIIKEGKWYIEESGAESNDIR
jgi:hypothetical protein